MGQLEQARIYIKQIDGLTKIDKLHESENEEVQRMAYYMVEKLFSDEDDVNNLCFFFHIK